MHAAIGRVRRDPADETDVAVATCVHAAKRFVLVPVSSELPLTASLVVSVGGTEGPHWASGAVVYQDPVFPYALLQLDAGFSGRAVLLSDTAQGEAEAVALAPAGPIARVTVTDDWIHVRQPH